MYYSDSNGRPHRLPNPRPAPARKGQGKKLSLAIPSLAILVVPWFAVALIVLGLGLLETFIPTLP